MCIQLGRALRAHYRPSNSLSKNSLATRRKRSSVVIAGLVLLAAAIQPSPARADWVSDPQDIVTGEPLVLQLKNSGEWCKVSREFVRSAGLCETNPGINEGVAGLDGVINELVAGLDGGINDNSVFKIDSNNNLVDRDGNTYPKSLLEIVNIFQYDNEVQEPTSNYAKDVEAQLEGITGFDHKGITASDYVKWSVQPNYGKFYSFEDHTQGIAITRHGIWVQTQSAGGAFCLGVVQSINPFLERDAVRVEWDSEGDWCDAHTTGIQAVGDYVAVHSFNTNGDPIAPDVKFFQVSPNGFFSPKPYLRLFLERNDCGESEGSQCEYTQVGIVHVKEVGYFLLAKLVGGAEWYFRSTLEDDGSDWSLIPRNKKINVFDNSGGNKLIMDENGSMYVFQLGIEAEGTRYIAGGVGEPARNAFLVGVIRPKRSTVETGKTDWDSPKPVNCKDCHTHTHTETAREIKPVEWWQHVARGDIKMPSFSILKEAGDDIMFGLPEPGSTATDHQFYFGGDVNVNEAGQLEFLQPPRDFLNPGGGGITQADYVVTRSTVETTPSNILTRGKVTRIKAIEVTGIETADDEVYLISPFEKGTIYENISSGETISGNWFCEFLPQNCGDTSLMTIESASDDGTYVYLMESDLGPGDLRVPPDKIGKIWIPPEKYALPGLHEYTAKLRGDGGEYEVTYETQAGTPDLEYECTPPAEDWQGTDVTIYCQWRIDGGVGTAALSTDVPENTEDANAATTPQQVCVAQGSTTVCDVIGPRSGNKVDKKPPMIPAAISLEATGPLTVIGIAEANILDEGSGNDPAGTSHNGNSAGLPVGTTVITWTAADFVGNVASRQQSVTIVDTTPPILAVPDDIATEATALLSQIELGVATATDLVTASEDILIENDANPLGLPLGTTIVTWTATDEAGNTVSAQQVVTIVDTTPPTIESLTATPSMLWPPNKRMRPVSVAIDVNDLVDESPSCELVNIQVNQSAPPGKKRGAPYEITGSTSALLLADGNGSGGDRRYTLHVTCTDFTGNASSATTDVVVPHDRRR